VNELEQITETTQNENQNKSELESSGHVNNKSEQANNIHNESKSNFCESSSEEKLN
jgi:hypothetical protein